MKFAAPVYLDIETIIEIHKIQIDVCGTKYGGRPRPISIDNYLTAF